MKRTEILLVDDDPAVLSALRRLLRPDGYTIFTAGGGREALRTLRETDVAVIVCDYDMGDCCGANVLAEAMRLRPDAVRVLLTGHAALSVAQSAINQAQISHFLLKPWDDNHLRSVVRSGCEEYHLKREMQRLHELTRRQRDQLREWNQRLEQKVGARTAALHAAYEETLDALVLALDTREHATAGHSRRVAAYCLFLALETGLPEDVLEDVYRGALLHDIGKIGVPDAVLLKPASLTAEERRVVEQHVTIGSRLVGRVGYLQPAANIPRYHHEKYDGTGYQSGLAGTDIPIEARIFAVVDVYDALTNERPYKAAMPHDDAIGIMAAERGRHFDPRILDAFLSVGPTTWASLAQSARHLDGFADVVAACQQLRLGRPAPWQASLVAN